MWFLLIHFLSPGIIFYSNKQPFTNNFRLYQQNRFMRPNIYFVSFSLVLLFILAFCNDQFVLYDDPSVLKEEDFTFIPQIPKNDKEVSLVYYGCEYNQTASVSINETSIFIVKKFNGAMKRPCILAYDTISLGRLEKGTYWVTLNIIDINPWAQDSLFSTNTKKLIVE